MKEGLWLGCQTKTQTMAMTQATVDAKCESNAKLRWKPHRASKMAPSESWKSKKITTYKVTLKYSTNYIAYLGKADISAFKIFHFTIQHKGQLWSFMVAESCHVTKFHDSSVRWDSRVTNCPLLVHKFGLRFRFDLDNCAANWSGCVTWPILCEHLSQSFSFNFFIA